MIEVTPSQISREQAEEIMQRLAAGDAWSGEFSVKKRDGSPFTAWVTDLPVLSEDGALVGVVGVSQIAREDSFRDLRQISLASWLRKLREKLRGELRPDLRLTIRAESGVRVRGNHLELDQIVGGILRIVWQGFGADCGIEISATLSSRSNLSEFGLIASPESLARVTIAPLLDAPAPLQTHTALGSLRCTSAVAALVGRASGFLFVKSDSVSPVTFNLFLPSAVNGKRRPRGRRSVQG